jgi:hypothetical protein
MAPPGGGTWWIGPWHDTLDEPARDGQAGQWTGTRRGITVVWEKMRSVAPALGQPLDVQGRADRLKTLAWTGDGRGGDEHDEAVPDKV